MRIASLCLLALTLAGCASRGGLECPVWELDSDHASCPQLRSSRLHLACSTATQNYEIEFIRNCAGDRLYVNLLTFRVPCGEIELGVQVDDQEIVSFPVQVFEGGQRMLLNCEATNKVVESLWNGSAVKLYLANRHATILPSNFVECYRDF